MGAKSGTRTPQEERYEQHVALKAWLLAQPCENVASDGEESDDDV